MSEDHDSFFCVERLPGAAQVSQQTNRQKAALRGNGIPENLRRQAHGPVRKESLTDCLTKGIDLLSERTARTESKKGLVAALTGRLRFI